VFSAIEDVTRQSAKRQIGPAQEYEHQSGSGDDHAEHNERFAYLRHVYSLKDRRELGAAQHRRIQACSPRSTEDYNFCYEMLAAGVQPPSLFQLFT
jgi:hypothetical protein